MSQDNNATPTVVAAAAVQYICTITVPDGDTVCEHPAVTFDALAAALQHAENEVHGVTGATYSVRCTVPAKQACSQVMASRNRAIYLDIGFSGGTHKLVEFKAPQVCKLVQALAAENSTMSLHYSAGVMSVWYNAPDAE